MSFPIMYSINCDLIKCHVMFAYIYICKASQFNVAACILELCRKKSGTIKSSDSCPLSNQLVKIAII